MDLKWFHDELIEEIDGAIVYAKTAIELKAMSDKMSKTFYDMAVQESEHAKNIYTMGIEYYNKIVSVYEPERIPEYLTEIKDKMSELYTSKSVDIKMLLSMYKD